jgi:DNA-binding transcriptional ArsR family regulator
MPQPDLLWDWGTAYDLFLSIEVLHQPAEFGVRPAWAAGVRARLPGQARETLEMGHFLCPQPLHWLHTLPEPKDALTALSALGQVPAGERLALLALGPGLPPDLQEILVQTSQRGTWDQTTLSSVRDQFRLAGDRAWTEQDLALMLDGWTRAREFGQRYLEALRAYVGVFFAEEEGRLDPLLREALLRAQALSRVHPLPELLAELSQIRIEGLPDLDELVLVPSFWLTPRTSLGLVAPRRAMWVFGARPPETSLVPGEFVPGTLLQTFKALSDPTRLRILQYLTGEALTSAELARRLRLRPQTVAHHIQALRLAGLVQTRMADVRSEKRYATSRKAIAGSFGLLDAFLDRGRSLDPPDG